MTLLRTTTAALLMGTALVPAAWADVTADQVWEQFHDYLTIDPNANITFDEPRRDGNALHVDNVRVVTNTPLGDEDDDLRLVATADYGNLVLTETNDGKVTFDMPADIPMTFGGSELDQGFSAVLRTEGMETIASEDGTAIVYDMKADRATILLAAPERAEFEFYGPDEIMVIDALKAQYRIDQTDGWNIKTTQSSGQVAFEFGVRADEDGEKVDTYISGKIASLSGDMDMVMPAGLDLNDPKQIFSGDLSMDGTFDLGAADLKIAVKSPDGPVDVSASADGSSGHVKIGGTSPVIDLAVNEKGLKVDVTVPEMPFPINVKLDEIGYDFKMPLAQSDLPAPAGVGFDIVGLVVNDAVWNMFDPGMNLPRDPATLRMGLTGKIKVLADLFDEDAMMSDDAPFEPVSARIDRLQLDAVGVKVNGEGAVNFDVNDTASYDGMPAPIGDVTITADGVTALIDRLIKMGIVPEDQAMMSRLMIGMFAEATGEDSLRSHIEFREGGSIVANGQKIR